MKRTAFSLVELALVLVILGLLVGGILSGQALVHASTLRSVPTDVNRFHAAIQAFQDKYNAIPGDMVNATDYWGLLGGTTAANDAACNAIAANGQPTCNGNGDGLINTGTMEEFRAWQQLANAGYIDGHYRGNGASDIPGLDVPQSRVANTAHWDLYYLGNYGTAAFFTLDYGEALYLTGDPNYPFSPEDALNIDQKMDDGRPASGKVVAARGTLALPCTSRAAQAYDAVLDPQATYTISDHNLDCPLFFTKLF